MDGSRLCRLVLGKAEAAPRKKHRELSSASAGGGSVHNHPPNAPKSLSPRRDPALATAGARLGAGMRSQVSVSIRVTPAPKQTQLGVERSPSRDVADVSPLPSSPFATRDAMLMGPRPCCPGVTRWAPWWQVAFASCPGRWGKRHRRHDGREEPVCELLPDVPLQNNLMEKQGREKGFFQQHLALIY